MKTLISSIVLLGIGFAAGYGVAKLGSNPLAVIPNPVAALNGEDSYEVNFEGNPGDKLVGSYVITTNPMRIEKIEDRLPYKVSFSAPRNVSVSATGLSLGKQPVKVIILRNGIECNSIVAVGSGVSEGSKTCF